MDSEKNQQSMIDIYSMYKPFSFSFRGKRMKIFENLFNPLNGKRILDVGGAFLISFCQNTNRN